MITLKVIITYNFFSRNVIERLEPQTLAERRGEVEQNKDYQDNLDKFETEVKQKMTGAVQAKQNTPFFAGIAVAVFAAIVSFELFLF